MDRYDPNPIIEGNDPQGYAEYANDLDRRFPDWYRDDPTGMSPQLAAEVLKRRLQTRPPAPLRAADLQSPVTAPFPGVFISPMLQGAIATFEIFKSYVDAGFTRQEALEITIDWMQDAREQHRSNENPGTT